MDFNDTLNLQNIFTAFGLVIQKGTADLLEYPERKKSLTIDWREQEGKTYDLTIPRFKDKEATLKCAMIGDTDVLFWAKYNALFVELKKEGWQQLFISDHNKTYEVFYKKSSNWKKTSKRLKGVEKVFVKFDLEFTVR